MDASSRNLQQRAFGRRSANRDTELADLGCPDCRGVLAVRALGPDDAPLEFRCRIGHVFSEASLLEAKEDQLEEALWTTAEVLKEIGMVYRELANRRRKDGLGAMAEAYEDRARRADAHLENLRAILSDDSPAILPENLRG